MDKKKILILTFLTIAVIGMTIGASSAALKVPKKYKITKYTNYYSVHDTQYDPDEICYYWMAKNTKNSYGNNVVIREYYYGSKTKANFYIYNNNGNKYRWTDCKSSKIKFNYKIVTNKGSIAKTKTFTYNKIPKYGLSKTITLNGPTNSKILISSIIWSRVHRLWY